MLVLWVVLSVLAVVLVVVPIHFYNRGVTLRNRCRESWSNVDTELRRRYDLIPNLVATVKAAARHERETLAAVTRARATAMADHGRPDHQAGSERPLVQALGRLLAVAEAYPDLQADGNFLALQKELALTEDRIQAARRFYNANVRDQRDLVHTFPGHVFARIYGFTEEDFFEVDPVVRSPVQVGL